MFSNIRSAGIIFSFNFHSKVQYIRPKVAVHKCVGVIIMRVLFKGGPYMRKYGTLKVIYSEKGTNITQ